MKKINDTVYTPSVNYGKLNYEKFGAPRVNQARTYSQEQWSKLVQPQIMAAQSQAQSQYQSNVAPHVNKATAAAAPYYSASRDNVFDISHTYILPAYAASRRYAAKTYATGYNLTMDVGLPFIQIAWSSTTVFLDRTLWPRLRILYGENIEPQLVRIGERLGNYREGKKLKSAMSDLENTSQASTTPKLSTASASASSVLTSEVLLTTTSSATVNPSMTPEQEAEQARERIEMDLVKWQENFAKAARKGTEDLQERVTEITNRQIQQMNGVGNAKLVELEETSKTEKSKLQANILTIVKLLDKESDETAYARAEDQLAKATKKAGLRVKDTAQSLRIWKENFDEETQSLVFNAANSTLEVIDNIRDLGLQEIGMRWAWMEGVTYKDWSKYHETKKTFDQYRKQVADVAHAHVGLREASDASEELEAKGMTIAEEVAKELGRLKSVGQWKIQALDDTEDFSTKLIPAKPVMGGKMVVDKISSVSSHIVGASQGTIESFVSQATQNAADAAAKMSSGIAETPQGSVESVASEARQQGSNAISSVSDGIIGSEPGMIDKASSHVVEAVHSASEVVVGTPEPKTESVYSAAKEKAINFASDASEAIVGTPPPAHHSVLSRASESASSVSSAIAEAIDGSSTPATISASRAADAAGSSASSFVEDASSAVSSLAGEDSPKARKVYGGAMAQEVKGQKPILDDIVEGEDTARYSVKVQEMVNQAGEKYADVTRAVSEALMKATTTQGTVSSASSVADEQYSKALSAASSVLYGSTEGASSVAANKWEDAVAA